MQPFLYLRDDLFIISFNYHPKPMKRIALVLMLSCMLSCTSSDQRDNPISSVETNDSKAESPPVPEAPRTLTFDEALELFIEKKEDKDALSDMVHFPFMNDVYEMEGIEEAVFLEKNEFSKILEEIKERKGTDRLSVEQLTDENYIHQLLYDHVMDEWGDTKNIYKAIGQADPTGFVAYFRKIKEEYKCIGFETTQSAEF